jgi:NADH-quinone oxidoreductase subunit I
MPVKPSDAASPVAEYFGTIVRGIRTTILGLGVTAKYLVKRPVTLLYPEEKPEVPPGFRGIHLFEKDKCIACDLCAAACPVDCIYIESIGKGKNAQLTRYEIDYNRCIFCALCVEPCPTSCIHMGQSYDLSRYTSDGCSVDFVKIWDAGQQQSPTGEAIVWRELPAKASAKPAGAQPASPVEASSGTPAAVPKAPAAPPPADSGQS